MVHVSDEDRTAHADLQMLVHIRTLLLWLGVCACTFVYACSCITWLGSPAVQRRLVLTAACTCGALLNANCN